MFYALKASALSCLAICFKTGIGGRDSYAGIGIFIELSIEKLWLLSEKFYDYILYSINLEDLEGFFLG